jgi:hypothetical protein
MRPIGAGNHPFRLGTVLRAHLVQEIFAPLL